MPNIRQMRKRESKRSKWTKEAMSKAMQEVQAGRQTTRQAAKQFGVPKSSLSDRLSGRVAAESVHGQKQLLRPEDENSLVEFCLYSASHGCPQRKHQVVAKALAIYNYRNPNKPRTVLGQTWWINFRERHLHRLASKTHNITDHSKKSCTKTGPVEDIPPPQSPPSSSSSNSYATHPLVASGSITGDLAHILLKTSQTCDIQKGSRRAHVLTAQGMAEVIKEVEGRSARKDGRSVKREGAKDTSQAVSSSTLSDGSSQSYKRRLYYRVLPASRPGGAGPLALSAATSHSHSQSATPSSTPSHMSLSSKYQHHQIVEAGSSTAEPTTSTGHIATKRQKLEKQILRCGQCRQPYPPKDPKGLVLWVQCDNCHKMFHTVCVSSEMDMDEDEFWCFWCLDV